MSARAEKLQALWSCPQFKTRRVSRVIAWSRYNFFTIVYLIWLKVSFYTTVVVKTWLVTETLSGNKHTLWLFIDKFIWIIRTRPN